VASVIESIVAIDALRNETSFIRAPRSVLV
jgi:hypothetical protein